jgi:serine/threonine protein kinase
LETITADDIENERETQELTKKQRVAFRLNPLFEGQPVPTAKDAIIAPEHIKEVSFGALLKDIDPLALDFIRKCLVVDGKQRHSCEQLLTHEYFDDEFKRKFAGVGLTDRTHRSNTEFEDMLKEDKKDRSNMMRKTLTTKDGKS